MSKLFSANHFLAITRPFVVGFGCFFHLQLPLFQENMKRITQKTLRNVAATSGCCEPLLEHLYLVSRQCLKYHQPQFVNKISTLGLYHWLRRSNLVIWVKPEFPDPVHQIPGFPVRCTTPHAKALKRKNSLVSSIFAHFWGARSKSPAPTTTEMARTYHKLYVTLTPRFALPLVSNYHSK